jgi:hypothetical protein
MKHSRVLWIDQPLKDADWTLTDARGACFEYPPDDGGKADYPLFDRQGRSLAMPEAQTFRRRARSRA